MYRSQSTALAAPISVEIATGIVPAGIDPARAHDAVSAMRADHVASATCAPDALAAAAALRSGDVARMPPTQKLVAAAMRALSHLPPEMRKSVEALVTPQNIEVLGGGAAVWGSAHLVGVGEIADGIAAVGAAIGLGSETVRVAGDVAGYLHGALTARSDADLDAAGEHLAHAVGAVGMDGVSALLLHRAAAAGPHLRAAGDAVVAQGAPALAIAGDAGIRPPGLPLAFDGPTTLEARSIEAPPQPRMTLAKHEAEGGHTIALHAGQSVGQLKTRLRDEPKLKVASSFFRASDADRALTSLFSDRDARARINAWKASGKRTRFEHDHRTATPVGRVLRRGATSAQETRAFRVILVRDDSPNGYYALTAYPLPEK